MLAWSRSREGRTLMAVILVKGVLFGMGLIVGVKTVKLFWR